MKLSAAIAGVFLLAAGSASARETMNDTTPVPGEIPASTADACQPYLDNGGDEEGCKKSIAYWADFYTAQIEDYLENPQGFMASGKVDEQVLTLQPKDVPNLHAEYWQGQIKGNCATLREVKNSSMTELVLNADQCLRISFIVAGQMGFDTTGIQDVGTSLQPIAAKLQAAPQ